MEFDYNSLEVVDLTNTIHIVLNCESYMRDVTCNKCIHSEQIHKDSSIELAINNILKSDVLDIVEVYQYLKPSIEDADAYLDCCEFLDDPEEEWCDDLLLSLSDNQKIKLENLYKQIPVTDYNNLRYRITSIDVICYDDKSSKFIFKIEL